MKKTLYIFFLFLILGCSNQNKDNYKGRPEIQAAEPDSTDLSDDVEDDSDLMEDWMWIILLSD